MNLKTWRTGSGGTATPSARPPDRRDRGTRTLIELTAAVALLILSHAVPSAPPVRARLIGALGRPAFFAAYGTVSIVVLVWVIVAFRRADPGAWLYLPPGEARAVAVLAMPLAVVLVVGRLMQRPADVPAGVYRITTVPGSLGVLLWALLHLINLGSARHVVLFGGMALIALIAVFKNARLAPAAHRHVGVFPFLAGLRGRERLSLRELAPPLLLGLVLYAALLWLHPMVIGRDPLAGVW